MSGSYSAWPFGCPAEWQEAKVPALIRTDMQDGYPKVRRQFTKDWTQYEGRWLLPLASVAAFRSFLNLDCEGGARPFRMADPLTGEERLFRWVDPPRVTSNVDQKPYANFSGKLEEVFS